MSLERLSSLKVKTAQANGKTRLLADGGGLYLRLAASGSRSWIFRYRSSDRQHDLGLGPYPDVGLAEARERALAQRKLRLDGIDPLAAKRAARAQEATAMTFRQCAEAYVAAHEPGWRGPRVAFNWRSSLATYAYPVMSELPVAAVELPHVLAVIEPHWSRAPETASRVRQRIEAVLDWATARGYRSGDNPARWKGHLDKVLPRKSRVKPTEAHPALPYAEIGIVMAALRERETAASRALEFAVLTAGRSNEVLGARWDEIDMSLRLWTIPAARMKGGKEHRVPLSDRAVEIVDQMAAVRTGQFVFPGRDGRPGHDTLRRELARLGRDDVNVHGFRSTFATWAAERTSYSYEVREMSLAHTVGNRVERAYQRSEFMEQRRRLMQAWAEFCATPAADSGEVVAIGRSA